mmetsp:Transcript_39512/g.88412  ORF Transcript_39512/g.88412 Transcript_39512/m.88412 type:complete len:356 (+) Transcript_39512:586-1653(+)
MNELPPALLLRLLQGLHLVIRGDVLAQGAEHDHGHDARQEEHDHERVDDGEVVDLVVGVALEVHVPAVGPRDVRRHPLDVVRVDHLVRLLHRLEVSGVVHGGAHLVAGGEGGGVLVEVLHTVPHVVDRKRDDLEADNARAFERREILVVLEDDADVVVEEVHLAPPLEGRRRHETHRKSTGHVVVLFVAHGAGQVVDDPVDAVLVVDDAPKQAHVRLVVVLLAQDLAPVRHLHLDLVKGGFDHVALEDLPQVFRGLLGVLGAAERQVVVRVRKLRLGRRDLVHKQRHLVSSSVRLGRDAGEVESGLRGRQRRQHSEKHVTSHWVAVCLWGGELVSLSYRRRVPCKGSAGSVVLIV